MSNRSYGRQYVIELDGETSRFHVTLGRDSIGFHKTKEGALAVAQAHARNVTIADAFRYSVVVR